jgi:hypothetical protein
VTIETQQIAAAAAETKYRNHIGAIDWSVWVSFFKTEEN